MNQSHVGMPVRKVPLFVVFLSAITLIFACMWIMAQGFEPSDDALRHVAKVISGKPWTEILLVRPEMTMDSHPGWHAILALVMKLTGAGGEGLLMFSVFFLFFLFAIVPVFIFRRPEAWVLTLLVTVVFYFGAMFRILYGRPFIFTMFVMVIFCIFWKKMEGRRISYPAIAGYALAVALATWIHGTWYFMALPLVALLLAGQRRQFLLFTVATAAGILTGALLTGSPFVFLRQMFFHATEAFGSHVFQKQLVTEFMPFDGAPLALLPVAILILWRRASGEWKSGWLDNPVFYLGLLGWGLGFFAIRFWTDWGWPAIAVWMAMELQRMFEKNIEAESFRRVWITVVICLIFFLAFTSDRDSRWTRKLAVPWPQMEKAEQRPWLPDAGGIVYNDSMYLFYNMFYHNPHAPWRYVLGFEPAWMPGEDLKIYRRIQLANGKADSFRSWIAKMTKKDRLMLIRNVMPNIGELEWHEVVPTVWSGKLR